MKVIFATLGSVGDLKPCLHLGMAAKGAGHDVVVMGNGAYASMAEGFKVPYLSITDKEDLALAADPDLDDPEKGLRAASRVLRTHIEPVIDLIEEHYVEDKTVIVAPGRVLGARIASEKLGCPHISLHMAPLYLRSFDGYDPDLIEQELGATVDNVRRRHGLTNKRPLLSHYQYSEWVVGLFPEWFVGADSETPENTRLLDFTLATGSGTLDPRLASFLDGGDPPLLFSPGTYTQQTRNFFETAIKVCKRLQMRGILAPVKDDMPLKLPPDVLAMPWVDYHAILPKCVAAIHAGGIGTTAECMRAGIPQLILPRVFDQRDNGEILASLGAGVVHHADSFIGRKAARMVDELITNQDVRASAFAMRQRVTFRPQVFRNFLEILRECHAQVFVGT